MGAGVHGGFGNTHGFTTIKNSNINDDNYLQHKLNYIYNGKKDFIPKNTVFKNKPKSIAGGGSSKPLRVEKQLIKKYGGKSGDWSKQAVKIESQKYIFDIHFYKKGKNQYMAKVKSRKEKD